MLIKWKIEEYNFIFQEKVFLFFEKFFSLANLFVYEKIFFKKIIKILKF